MAFMALRRWDDNVLLNDCFIEFSGFRWRSGKPNHRTLIGVTVPQKTSVQELWWEATMEFASDDPVNTFARYDSMAYDANWDRYFKFVDTDGSIIKCQIMQPPEVDRLDLPTVHVTHVKCVFKMDGYVP